MESRHNNSIYQGYARNSDVHFIFDDAVPCTGFYAVPRLDIFAFDSERGYLATFGEVTDINSGAAIYYVDKNNRCFIVADNLKEFIDMLDADSEWKGNAKETDNIVLYPSRDSAMQSLEFIQIPDDILQALQ